MTQPDQYFPSGVYSAATNATPGFGTYAGKTADDYMQNLQGPWAKTLGPLARICALVANLPLFQGLRNLGSGSNSGPMGEILTALDQLSSGPKDALNNLITALEGVNWFTPTGIIAAFNALIQFAKDIINWVREIVQVLLGIIPPTWLKNLQQVFELELLHADWNQFTAALGAINWSIWNTVPDLMAAWSALLTFLEQIVQWGRLVLQHISGFDLFAMFQVFDFPALRAAFANLKNRLLAINWANWAIAPDLMAAFGAFVQFAQDIVNWGRQVIENILNGVDAFKMFQVFDFPALRAAFSTGKTQLLAINWTNPAAIAQFVTVAINFVEAVGNWLFTVFNNITGAAAPTSAIQAFWDQVLNLAQSIIDAFANNFLQLPGTGFSVNDLIRSIQSIPAKFLTGTILPGQTSLVNVGTLSNLLPQFLVNPTFDTPNSILGNGIWTWDGTQGPPGLATSVFTDAAGVLRELLSNNISATVGQTFNISGLAQWFGFSGAANSIALTVAQFDQHYNLLGYDTIASVASPGATSSGWVTLANTAYTVPATPPGIASIVLRPIVSQTATAGRVWFGNMSIMPTATTMAAPLVPLLDASKIGTGLLPQNMVNNLTTDLGTLTSGVNAAALQTDLANTWHTIITSLSGSGSGLSGVAAALAAIPGANISGSISTITTNIQNLIDAILQAFIPGYVAGSGTLTSITTAFGAMPQANITGLVSSLNAKALAADLTNLLSTIGLGTATLTAVTNRLANLSATGTMPQAAITGLVSALNATALQSDLTALMNNLGAGSPTLSSITNRFTNLTAAGVYNGNLPIPQVINLSSYLSNLNTSGVLSGVGAVNGLSGYLSRLDPSTGVLNNIAGVAGLPGYLNYIASNGAVSVGALVGTISINNVPTTQLTRTNINDLGNVYNTINTTVGSGCIIYRASTAAVSLSSNVGAQLAPGGFFDSISVSPSSDLSLTLGTAMFQVSLAGWYRCDICYQVQPAVSAIWNITPVLFRNGGPAKYGVDSISFYTAATGGATPRSLQSSFEIYCQAGDTLQAGLDAKNNTGSISNVLTGSNPAQCYFAISLENRSLT